jgi:hypothetical protein
MVTLCYNLLWKYVCATRGTTALVYCLINSSLQYIQVLYKGGGVHPNWFDGQ